MSWGLLKWAISAIGDSTRSQKPTETGTETVDTETASGIMAVSQTTGHGIYSPPLERHQ
jgi:hypothetical protein